MKLIVSGSTYLDAIEGSSVPEQEGWPRPVQRRKGRGYQYEYEVTDTEAELIKTHVMEVYDSRAGYEEAAADRQKLREDLRRWGLIDPPRRRYPERTGSAAVVDLGDGAPWFRVSDGGRSESKRPRQSNDCLVRALAIVYDRPYDEVYDRVARMGRKSGQGTETAAWQALLRVEGWTRHGWPAPKRGERRMHPDQFCVDHPTGRWILREAGHVSAVVDGIYYDLSRPWDDRCVYNAWEMPAGLAGKPIQS